MKTLTYTEIEKLGHSVEQIRAMEAAEKRDDNLTPRIDSREYYEAMNATDSLQDNNDSRFEPDAADIGNKPTGENWENGDSQWMN